MVVYLHGIRVFGRELGAVCSSLPIGGGGNIVGIGCGGVIKLELRG